MKIQPVEKIEDLSDVFYALMGGKPEKVADLDDFIRQSPLKELIHAADVRNILEFDAFFPDETIDGVYALLPVMLPLSRDRQLVLTPKAFYKLNQQRISRPASRSIGVSFPKAMKVYQNLYGAKIDAVEKAIADIQRKKAAKAAEEVRLAKIAEAERAERIAEAHRLLQAAEEKKQAKIEAEKKAAAEAEAVEAARREKNRLRMQAYRAAHPEKIKSYYKRLL